MLVPGRVRVGVGGVGGRHERAREVGPSGLGSEDEGGAAGLEEAELLDELVQVESGEELPYARVGDDGGREGAGGSEGGAELVKVVAVRLQVDVESREGDADWRLSAAAARDDLCGHAVHEHKRGYIVAFEFVKLAPIDFTNTSSVSRTAAHIALQMGVFLIECICCQIPEDFNVLASDS